MLCASGSSFRPVKVSYDFCYDRLLLWVYGLVLSEPKIIGRKKVVNTGDMLVNTERRYCQLSQTDDGKTKT